MKVQEAIETLQILGDYHFYGRNIKYNPVEGKKTWHYNFEEGTFHTVGALRRAAKEMLAANGYR